MSGAWVYAAGRMIPTALKDPAMRSPLLPAVLLCLVLVLPAHAQPDLSADHLDGTEPLVMDEPLDVVMVRGINYFAEREIADSPNRRPAKWNRDYSSVEAYEKSVEPNRERLREIIGAVDERSKDVRELLVHYPAGPIVNVAWLNSVDVSNVSWDALAGVMAEGVHVKPGLDLPIGIPRVPPEEVDEPLGLFSQEEHRVMKNYVAGRAVVIFIPDADQSPEDILGITDEEPRAARLIHRLVANGIHVHIPALIDRSPEFSGNPNIRYTNLPHREFIYRMAFEMGRHVIGYEVQKMLALVDRLQVQHERPHIGDRPIIVVGVGEGGLLALHTAAIDPRVDACVVSGYFSEREGVWQEPIYRNVWRQLSEFGDADLASLIAPRHLIVEAAPAPEIDGPPQPTQGRSAGAAPGRIVTPGAEAVSREFDRASAHFERLEVHDHIQLIRHDANSDGTDELLQAILRAADLDDMPADDEGARTLEVDRELSEEELEQLNERIQARQKRQVAELDRFTQALMHRSDKVRYKFWANVDLSSVEACENSLEFYRDYVYDNMIGRLLESEIPLNPRTRKVIDEPTHVGYEVVLDCYPAGDTERPIPEGADTSVPATGSVDGIGWAVGEDWGVIAGGILLLPKDLKEGEQRPVVVCQHGLEGTPMDTITTDPADRSFNYYKGFSTALVKRGFIVYAAQNPYRGYDAFRVIQRKSNPMGRSLFSYIIPQHGRTLEWLASLPYVDRDRIGFYGLSYGGKTAVRVPPMLVPSEDKAGYCLSICSADYNEWVRKNASSEDRYSYVFTGEYEIFEWNMGHVANYAELSYLMTPRPFMVERGHDDGVAPDEWVAWEYAKVRRHYDKLGILDNTEIEFFNGPHTINGVGTYEFLHKHLDWPKRQ